jgi:hypothetical protein
MADYIAQERRQHQLVTPEIMAHQRWRGHVMTCAIIAVFAVALVTLRPF